VPAIGAGGLDCAGDRGDFKGRATGAPLRGVPRGVTLVRVIEVPGRTTDARRCGIVRAAAGVRAGCGTASVALLVATRPRGRPTESPLPADMPANKYPDDPSRSAELLRLALPHMSRQAAGVHPVSYAVWYEHVSGRNPALSAAILKLTAGDAVLDEDMTLGLYLEHVASLDERINHQMADSVRKVLADMSESAKVAGAQTDRFGDSLSRLSSSVREGAPLPASALEEVLSQTGDMREAVGQLKGRLDSSQREIERLREEVDRARNEALVDALTSLANRRAFEQRLAELLEEPNAAGCLVVTDIDHFKKINDSYGHLFGDHVLRVVAQALKGCTAAPQMAARVGGEEFAVLLPGIALAQAQHVAEKIRTAIAGSRIRRRDTQESIGQVTVSLGVAARLPGEPAEAWYERADKALYASKQGGRNRVTVADH